MTIKHARILPLLLSVACLFGLGVPRPLWAEGSRTVWCRDADGDGYGNPCDTVESDTQPTG